MVPEERWKEVSYTLVYLQGVLVHILHVTTVELIYFPKVSLAGASVMLFVHLIFMLRVAVRPRVQSGRRAGRAGRVFSACYKWINKPRSGSVPSGLPHGDLTCVRSSATLLQITSWKWMLLLTCCYCCDLYFMLYVFNTKPCFLLFSFSCKLYYFNRFETFLLLNYWRQQYNQG